MDLTGAGGRFSPRDLLESLLEPSAVISDQYQDTALVLVDDAFLVGRIESEADGWLVLNEAPHGETTHEIALADIVERAPHPVSRMPAGLLDTLQADEILDLMAFVLAGGDPEAPAFASGE